MSALIPDGYFVDDHLVWGDLGRGGILSRGYRLQFPDNSASDDDAFIELEDNIRKVLSACQKDERLQLQFYTSSDYQGLFSPIRRGDQKKQSSENRRDPARISRSLPPKNRKRNAPADGVPSLSLDQAGEANHRERKEGEGI